MYDSGHAGCRLAPRPFSDISAKESRHVPQDARPSARRRPRRHRHRPSRKSVTIDQADERAHPQGGHGELADHEDHALPDGRARPAAHRLAESRERGEVGGEADGAWGFKNGKLEPWDFSTVGNDEDRARGLAERKGQRPHHLAGEGQPRVRGAGVDAVHQGHRHRLRPCTSSRRRVRSSRTPDGGGRPGGGGQQRLGPTEAELKAYLASMAPKMKGAIVLVGAHTRVPFQETPPAKRRRRRAAEGAVQPDPNAAPPARGRARRPRRRRRRGRGGSRAGRSGASDAAAGHDA